MNHPVVELWKNKEEPEPIKIPPPNTDWVVEEEKIARERGRKLLEQTEKEA